jgi:hypothetical protein
MPANTVEAVLRSKFEDGIARGIEHTQRTMAAAMSNIRSASGTAAAGFEAAWRSIDASLGNFSQRLQQAAAQSTSDFSRISFAAGAASVLIVGALVKAARAATDFLFQLAKESSEALETKLAFESLTAAAEIQADVFAGKLKRATEGLVSGTVLLQNANRVLQAHIPITSDMYVRLVENVFSLAKATGKEGAEAVNVLTDALIRGNSRGFQAIGIHLNVRDAVSAAAEAMGQASNHLADHSRLQAFYNDLLLRTDRAVSALGPRFISIEDALKQTDMAWKGFLSSLGQAIGRSQVLQELFGRLSDTLFQVGLNRTQLDGVTLAANQFFLTLLRGIADVMEVLGLFSLAWDALSGVVKVFVNGAAALVAGLFRVTASGLTYLLEILGKLPGNVGRAFVELAAETRWFADYNKKAFEEFGRGVASAFTAFGSSDRRLVELANQARVLAGEMEKYKDQIVRGAVGNKTFGDSAAQSAEDMKKLIEQERKYQELRRELNNRGASDERQALNQLAADHAKIEAEITAKGAEWDKRRAELRLAADLVYERRIREIQARRETEDLRALQELMDAQAKAGEDREQIARQAEVIDRISGEARIRAEQTLQRLAEERIKREEEARQKALQDSLAAASAIERTIGMAAKGKLPTDIGQDALGRLPQMIATLQRQLDELRSRPIIDDRQVDEILRLEAAVERLNRINMTPFQKAMEAMKAEILQLQEQGVQAFADFFADLVSQQDSAGKRLVAAFIGMIGKMLVNIGVILVQAGIAEVALAQTFIGRALGASAAAGWKAIAVGALLAAAGGIMQGLATSMTQQASSQSTAQSQTPASTTPTATSSQTPVINVGAPRRPDQTTSGSSSAEKMQADITIRLQTKEGWVAGEVVREVKRNNQQLRLAIQTANA